MKPKTQLQWLGHSAFRIVSPDGNIIYIDPFLSKNPSTPDAFKKVDDADVILLTHGHDDHVGDTLDIAARTGAQVAGIVELIGLLQQEGLSVEQSIAFNKGGSIHFEDFSVTMVHANHSSSYKGAYAGDPAGLILSFDDDICIYHMGDTNIFSDLQLYGELYEPDVVLAPIGDHFTMGPEEAAYAVELVGAKIAIPMHYGTWE
ncbi:MAG: metal-dependent hydrolase, partial [Bacteroidota bacterium]